MSTLNLQGLGVLVTRPAHQAGPLCELIQAHNGRPLPFPVLTITPVADSTLVKSLLSQAWDVIIYTSTNSVAFCPTPPLLLTGEGGQGAGAAVIAIGTATANAVQAAYGPINILIPTPQNSEGILALPILAQPAGLRILIVRGEGGRSLLSETLVVRGALLSVAEVYRRGLPSVDVAPLIARWAEDVQAIVATSGESLDNLIQLLGEAGHVKLLKTPVITISARLQQVAKNLGFTQVICATGADDESILTALLITAGSCSTMWERDCDAALSHGTCTLVY